ncbi:hypothetical protein HDV01_006308, partial [Terramyces sp. JEL0728]
MAIILPYFGLSNAKFVQCESVILCNKKDTCLWKYLQLFPELPNIRKAIVKSSCEQADKDEFEYDYGADQGPWCTLIVGNPNTMIDAVNPFQLNVGVDLAKSDPFLQCLTFNSDTKRFAGVGVDFTNRRRNKVAGVINEFNVRDCSIGMQLLTNENMGNCPKYITVRQLKRIERKEQVVHDQMNAGKVVLDQECRNIINQASTIFLATRHNDQDARNSDLGMNHSAIFKGLINAYIQNLNLR